MTAGDGLLGPVGPAGPPPPGTPVPRSVARVAAGRPVEPVWRNELGGTTWRVADDVHVKWAPAGTPLRLGLEAEKLVWAARWTRVPQPLDVGEDADGGWLVTRTLPGRSAVDQRWTSRPEVAVPELGRALRALHDALPVEECPWSWSFEERRSRAELLSPDRVGALGEAPPVDRLVVCHGDACSPNTLLGDDGRWTGHVDLAALGTADRWADLAVATWSTQWNYGAGWELPLLEAYGVEPDPVRTASYRLLWDLT